MKWLRYSIFLVTLSGCSLVSSVDNTSNQSDTSGAPLIVYFTNDSASLFPIISIELSDMGKMQAPVYSGVWSNNILVGDTLVPGEMKTFSLSIASGKSVRYRLGVIDSLGGVVFIHEQPSYIDSAALKPTISHWGSDFRNVDVTVGYNSYSKSIAVSGWSDMAAVK